MRYLALLFSLAISSTPAIATPITFTGAELASLPGASFPTGTSTIMGDSLVIDPETGLGRGIVYRLSLDNFVVDPTDISIALDTRLIFDDNGDDFSEIVFGIYDGVTFFGGDFVTAINEETRAQREWGSLSADETRLDNTIAQGGPTAPTPFNLVHRFEVFIQERPTNVVIDAAANGVATNQSSNTGAFFDPDAEFSFIISLPIFLTNNVIESVTFTSGITRITAAPEPGTLAGTALGLMALGFGLHRRRRSLS